MATVTIRDSETPGGVVPASKPGEPTWEMTEFYPRQGDWTEREYLALNSNRLLELSDGVLEFLPRPTLYHQNIVAFLYQLLVAHVGSRNIGKVVFAPLPVRLFEGRYREPDIVFLNHEHVKAAGGKYPQGADLVVEVVSEGEESRKRDLDDKPIDYAQAGIKEYWIVDPETRTITVLSLDGRAYRVHGIFPVEEDATSVLFDGFAVRVADVFAAGEQSQADIADQPASQKDTE